MDTFGAKGFNVTGDLGISNDGSINPNVSLKKHWYLRSRRLAIHDAKANEKYQIYLIRAVYTF